MMDLVNGYGQQVMMPRARGRWRVRTFFPRPCDGASMCCTCARSPT